MSSYGKKTRSPGYRPGNHWVIDEISGFAIRNSDSMVNWKGQVVSKESFEFRHPQDFVRGVKDDTSAKGNINPDDREGRGRACKHSAFVAGYAIAGCAVAGNGLDYYVPGSENLSPDDGGT